MKRQVNLIVVISILLSSLMTITSDEIYYKTKDVGNERYFYDSYGSLYSKLIFNNDSTTREFYLPNDSAEVEICHNPSTPAILFDDQQEANVFLNSAIHEILLHSPNPNPYSDISTPIIYEGTAYAIIELFIDENSEIMDVRLLKKSFDCPKCDSLAIKIGYHIKPKAAAMYNEQPVKSGVPIILVFGREQKIILRNINLEKCK